jgi:hypothetical protein
MGGTCSTDERYWKYKSLVAKLEGKRFAEDLGADGRGTLKWTLKEQGRRM